MSRRKQIALGEQAEALLNNSLFNEAFDSVHQLIVMQLEEQMLDGSDEQNNRTIELVRRLQTLKGIKRVIHHYVHTGQLAEADFDSRKEH